MGGERLPSKQKLPPGFSYRTIAGVEHIVDRHGEIFEFMDSNDTIHGSGSSNVNFVMSSAAESDKSVQPISKDTLRFNLSIDGETSDDFDRMIQKFSQIRPELDMPMSLGQIPSTVDSRHSSMLEVPAARSEETLASLYGISRDIPTLPAHAVDRNAKTAEVPAVGDNSDQDSSDEQLEKAGRKVMTAIGVLAVSAVVFAGTTFLFKDSFEAGKIVAQADECEQDFTFLSGWNSLTCKSGKHIEGLFELNQQAPKKEVVKQDNNVEAELND